MSDQVTSVAVPAAVSSSLTVWRSRDSSQDKAISTLEVLGGLGVILPWLFNIAPVLTPIAAIGCGLVMIGALRVHLLRHEPKALPPAVVLLVLPVAVAAIRFSQL